MFAPFEKLLGALHISGNYSRLDSPTQKSNLRLKGDNNITVIQQSTPLQKDEKLSLANALRDQWLFSNDGYSPARMAGIEWGSGEKEWVNQQLDKRGLDWRVD